MQSIGEIRTLKDGRILRLEKFKGLDHLNKKIRSVEIYSMTTGETYEIEILFYDNKEAPTNRKSKLFINNTTQHDITNRKVTGSRTLQER